MPGKLSPEQIETQLGLAVAKAAKVLGTPPVVDPLNQFQSDPSGLITTEYGGPAHQAIVASCRKWLADRGLDPDRVD